MGFKSDNQHFQLEIYWQKYSNSRITREWLAYFASSLAIKFYFLSKSWESISIHSSHEPISLGAAQLNLEYYVYKGINIIRLP